MKTAVEQALESLQQKRKHFIGKHKDSNSITETKGFLQVGTLSSQLGQPAYAGKIMKFCPLPSEIYPRINII
jgi:hypothetical protein